MGWEYKENHFFNYYNTQPQHRLFMASSHIEGKTIVWFQEMDETRAMTSWESLVKAIQICFGKSFYDDPME
jgi:hypothetical protein